VVIGALTRLGGGVLNGVRRDVAGLVGILRPLPEPAAGLHTYRFTPAGGEVRVHLRVEADGRGVMFVDVTEVIHLNAPATLMAKLALDGVPLHTARAALAARTVAAGRAGVIAEVAEIYRLVSGYRDPDGTCPACANELLDRTGLFERRARAPYKADLALTYGCNNQCPRCYNEADRLAMRSLGHEQWRQVLDRLHGIGVPHVVFTGGEATLHPELPALVSHADRAGQLVGLNSNGRRMATASYVDELVAAGLNHVQITLGSHRPEAHDAMMGARSFGQTVRGIENALASPLYTITNTTLTRGNFDHAEAIVEFLHGLGIRTFAMNGNIHSGGGFADPDAITEAELPALLTRVRDRAAELGLRFLWYTPTEYCRMSPLELELGAKRCNAAEYSICIEPNGDVLPCQSFYVSAGNVLRDRWETIWDSELFLGFRDRGDEPRRHKLPRKCWECPDLPLCGGGCRIEREAREGRRVAVSAPQGRASATAVGYAPGSGLTRTTRRASAMVAAASDHG
jgi:radical SAM protein with 4Fe4S-binding SPASM domain